MPQISSRARGTDQIILAAIEIDNSLKPDAIRDIHYCIRLYVLFIHD